MRAGYFKRTYEVWREEKVPDGGGGFELDWVKQTDVTGRAYPTRTSDDVTAQKRQGIVTWTFACGPDEDVRETDQIRFDGRELTVQAVSITSTGQRLEALCEEER